MTRHALMILVVALLLAADTPRDKAPSEKLKPPKGHVELLRLKAKGVQIYESKAKGDDFEWSLKEPKAELFDDKDTKVGKHYRDAGLKGPAWEAKDGSKVVAAVPPLHSELKTDTIPWLLLKARANEGKGVFSKVTYILRVDTVGGKPPQPPKKAEEIKEVKYEASYIFYGTR